MGAWLPRHGLSQGPPGRALRVFCPSFHGVYTPKTLAEGFNKQLAGRIRCGLFPRAKPWRNRYVIGSSTGSSLRFSSAGFWTSVAVGLNDVEVRLEDSPTGPAVRYEVTCRMWAGYCVGLGLLLALLLLGARYVVIPN